MVHEPGDDGGYDVAFHGEFREVRAPHLVVTTELHEGMPQAAVLDTVRRRCAGPVPTARG